MRTFFLSLASLAFLFPQLGFAAGKSDLINSIDAIFAGTGDVFGEVMRSESLSTERKFQTLSNASKSKHDSAMAAIQNTR